jgi:hypothetical protein
MPDPTNQQIQASWDKLTESISSQHIPALTLVGYLLLGGIMAIYIRWLYRRFGASPSDADSITRVFPLLTLVTIGVISVVKSSMALSLGLVGALSIVRFRAAIKEPEELVYLFLCIGVGLGLGAGQPLLSLALIGVASVYIIGMHIAGKGRRDQRLMLTITGPSGRFTGQNGILALVTRVCGSVSMQRFDLDGDRGQVRIGLKTVDSAGIALIVTQLQEQLPDCELSFVDLNSLA